MTEKEVPLEKIEVGMELASDVVNKYKQVLISSSARFEEKHRFLLKTWGIKTVKIKFENEEEKISAITEEQRADALKELKKKMLWEPRNEFEIELVQIAIEKICLKNLDRK